jgi:hypothetical protein
MMPPAADAGDELRIPAPPGEDPADEDVVVAAACGAITLAELQGCDLTRR